MQTESYISGKAPFRLVQAGCRHGRQRLHQTLLAAYDKPFAVAAVAQFQSA